MHRVLSEFKQVDRQVSVHARCPHYALMVRLNAHSTKKPRNTGQVH